MKPIAQVCAICDVPSIPIAVDLQNKKREMVASALVRLGGKKRVETKEDRIKDLIELFQ